MIDKLSIVLNISTICEFHALINCDINNDIYHNILNHDLQKIRSYTGPPLKHSSKTSLQE